MIEIIGLVLVFIAGLFIGSFLNVVAERVPAGESPVKGRSKCDSCKNFLFPKDLVPLFSFILLRAKCRYCDSKISLQYPLSELVTGALFAVIAYYLGVFSNSYPYIWITFVYFIVIASFLIVLFISDIKYKIIPNRVIVPAIVFVLVYFVLSFGFVSISSYYQMQADAFGRYLLEVGYWQSQVFSMLRTLGVNVGSSLGLGLFFWVLIVITKGRGMGGGDVKLAFLIGLINGFPLNIVAIIMGFVLGALYSLVLVVLKRKDMKDVIPFGPFLIIGSVASFVVGSQILEWYLGLL